VSLKQPAHWWSLQLEHSKDVVAQAQAVAGLAAQLGAAAADGSRTREQALLDEYILTILAGVMRNPGVFCRCGCVQSLLPKVRLYCVRSQQAPGDGVRAWPGLHTEQCHTPPHTQHATNRVRLDAAMALGAASVRLPGDKCMRELVAFTRCVWVCAAHQPRTARGRRTLCLLVAHECCLPDTTPPHTASGIAHTTTSHKRERLYDALTGLPRPNGFQDLAEALLTQGLPAALALLRDEQG
jgi:hypothetical protein